MLENLLAFVGGSWHDFDAFSHWLETNSPHLDVVTKIAADTAELTDLAVSRVDVVLLYNCFDERSRMQYSDAQVEALVHWVAAGGRALGLHSATVAARDLPPLRTLLGAAFRQHPPASEVRVHAVAQHPITTGIEPFCLHDELYRHELNADIFVHLMANDGADDVPIGWTRNEGAGKVAYLGLGHDARAWSHPAYLRLMKQSLRWLVG